MSRIACACSADSSNCSIRPARAASGSFDARMSSITASMFDERDQQALEDVRAPLGPLELVLVRRVTTSFWCWM